MLGYVPWIGSPLQRVARGGAEIGADTLVLFYTVHTSIVPALLVVLMAFHFWRVRKAGGVVVPPPGAGEPRQPSPRRCCSCRTCSCARSRWHWSSRPSVVVLGAAFGAPLGAPANPGMSPNPAKAPWYFLGFQELLVHFHPVVAIVVIPLAGAVALLLLPYITADDEPAGAWFLSDRGWRAARVAALVAPA